ncbi:MAG TPA: hypothetical protein ENF20_05780 [Candidatus Marinimicrobia bacterium]|nr:hypothetical protein [Candidatus Neomarinimicrobiota bacterium]
MQDKEIGLVLEKDKESVTVELFRSDACDRCAARVLCKSIETGKRVVKAISETEANIGDAVEIEQIGKNVLKISLLQYGIPLALFIITTISFYSLLKTRLSHGMLELIAFLSATAVVIISGFLIRVIFRKISRESLPMFKVIKVVQKAQEKEK